MDVKRKICKVFQDAMEDVCSFLPTDSRFFQELVDSGALTGADKETLEDIESKKGQRKELVEILQVKSYESYFTFMVTLQKHQWELHERLKKLEEKHNLEHPMKAQGKPKGAVQSTDKSYKRPNTRSKMPDQLHTVKSRREDPKNMYEHHMKAQDKPKGAVQSTDKSYERPHTSSQMPDQLHRAKIRRKDPEDLYGMDVMVSESDMGDLINVLGPSDLQNLFIALKLKSKDIQKVEVNADTHNISLRAREVLKYWRLINGSYANRHAILGALQECRNMSAKKALEDKWNKEGPRWDH